MQYLKFADLPSLELTEEEEAHLDADLSHEAWCKKSQGRYGRNIHVIEAIEVFKDDVYYLALDNSSAKWGRDLMMKLKNTNNLDIDKAKNVPITELIGGAGFTINRAGFIKCPFHDDGSASMKIYPKTNTWYCFGCNEGSSTVDFIMKLNKCDFTKAVTYLT